LIDIILSVLATIAIAYLVYLNIRQRLNYKKLDNDHNQVVLDYRMFKDMYDKLFEELNSIKVEKDDGFVKFLSESRDWAFQYIESTQVVVEIYNSEVQAILESDDKPAQKLSKIKAAHKDLLAILPEKP
jgi:carboxypeptidase C (cathepsin A)